MTRRISRPMSRIRITESTNSGAGTQTHIPRHIRPYIPQPPPTISTSALSGTSRSTRTTSNQDSHEWSLNFFSDPGVPADLVPPDRVPPELRNVTGRDLFDVKVLRCDVQFSALLKFSTQLRTHAGRRPC